VSDSGLPHTEKHGHSGAIPVEGHQAGPVAGPHHVEGEVERAGFVQPGGDSVFCHGFMIWSTEVPRNCTSSAESNKSLDILWLPVGQTFEKPSGDESLNMEVKIVIKSF